MRRLALDMVLALALAVWWVADVGEFDGLGVASLALMTLPLAWRRVAPLACVAVVGAGFVVGCIPETQPEPLAQLVATVVAAYSASAHAHGDRIALAGGAIAVLAAAAGAILVGDDLVFIVLISAFAWGAGLTVRRLRGHSEELEAKAVALDERARTAATHERERIARELHDVVSHSVSLMVVQAGAAEQVLDENPEQARRALEALQATGRSAVDDLRRMLGLLRGADGHELAPQPGLAALDELLAAHGPNVRLHREPLPPLPPGVDLTAYRVVQEGLTNARRHAPGRPTDVRVGFGGGTLHLEVRTEGVAANGAHPTGGHGLIGMRERVTLYGGQLFTGREGGDWIVRASLPVPP